MTISSTVRDKIIELAKEVYDKKPFFDNKEFTRNIYNIFIIKKMAFRFLKTGNINEKLILNNIIIILNTFDVQRANQMFRVAMGDAEFSIIKTCLIFLDAYDLDDETETNDILYAILMDVARRMHLRYKFEH